MHQKINQTAEPSSATLHGAEDEDEDHGIDPFRDADDEDLDDDEDDLDEATTHDITRESWWRGMVGRKTNTEETPVADVEDEEDEFGDFAMAEDVNDKGGEADSKDNLLLRPVAVKPTKESTRGLSGLWPFGSRNEASKTTQESENMGEPGNDTVVVSAANDKIDRSQDRGEGAGAGAIKVKEATNRTSIEEPDDEEVVVGPETVSDPKTD